MCNTRPIRNPATRGYAAADDVLDRLGAAGLCVPAHQTIFEGMRRLYDDGQPIDTVTVVDRLDRACHLEVAGGAELMVGFWDAVLCGECGLLHWGGSRTVATSVDAGRGVRFCCQVIDTAPFPESMTVFVPFAGKPQDP